jgi:hypothetical protein
VGQITGVSHEDLKQDASLEKCSVPENPVIALAIYWGSVGERLLFSPIDAPAAHFYSDLECLSEAAAACRCVLLFLSSARCVKPFL